MSTPLTLSASRRADGTPVLTATGEIDLSNAGTVTEALASAVAETAPVLLDLTRVTYLDSAGLTVLFTFADRIRLVAPPLLQPVLTISGLTELTVVEESGADSSN